MSSQRFRNLFQAVNPITLSIGMMSFLSGLICNIVSNVLGSDWRTLSMLTTGLLVLSMIMVLLSPKAEVEARIEARTLRTDEEKRRSANRGLITFVSLYRPIKGKPPAGDSDIDWVNAARAMEYKKLDLENSNLATAINAAVGHASRLEHCWLIGTISTDLHQPGSIDYEPALVEFLKKEKNLACEFHSGPEYAIALDDDALVCTKTYDLVRRLYRQAASDFKIAPSDMIADFTGCPRSMTLGLILACLSVDKNIQLMGTRYDGAGRPVGQPVPIIFSFEPLLRAKC
jgi:hypothetical protein